MLLRVRHKEWGQRRREVHGTLSLGETQKDGKRNLCFGHVKHPGPQEVWVRWGRFERPPPKSVTIKNNLILGLRETIGMEERKVLKFSEYLLGARKHITNILASYWVPNYPAGWIFLLLFTDNKMKSHTASRWQSLDSNPDLTSLGK